MRAGQLALQDKSRLVVLSNRPKNYAEMPKSMVSVELVEILTGILQQKDYKKIVGTFLRIPEDKLPERQIETMGMKKIVLTKKKNDVKIILSDQIGKSIICLQEHMCICVRKSSKDFEKYIQEFAKELFEEDMHVKKAKL